MMYNGLHYTKYLFKQIESPTNHTLNVNSDIGCNKKGEPVKKPAENEKKSAHEIKGNSSSGKEIKKNINNITTVNNYHVNINIFLQQECNNAVNWFDFIKSLNIGESEINDAINTNLTSSMTNVLLKGINDFAIELLPFPCTIIYNEKRVAVSKL